MSNKYWLFGTHLTILEEADHTDGRFDFISGIFDPGVETPLHVHRKYSESIYVIEGAFTVHMQGEIHHLKPGDHIFIPIGVPHAVACRGNQPGTALTVASPSGFAGLIRQLGIPGDENTVPQGITDMKLFQQIPNQ